MLAKSIQSCPTLCDPMVCTLPGFSVHEIFPGKNTRMDCHAFLQGISLTQGSNLHLIMFPGLAGGFFTTVQCLCGSECKLFFFLMYTFYWSVVDLQCFKYTGRWFCYAYTHIIFKIIFDYRLLQDTGCSSLCYIVNLCCVSVFLIRYLAFN